VALNLSQVRSCLPTFLPNLLYPPCGPPSSGRTLCSRTAPPALPVVSSCLARCILQVGHCVPESLGGCGPATLLQPRHEPAGARAALSHTHTQEARQEQGRPRRCALFTLHMRVQDNLHTHTYIVAHTHPTHKYAHGCAVAQFTRKWSLGWKEDPEGAPAHVLVHDACVCTPACTQDKCPGRIRARAYIHTHAFTCPQNCKHLYTL